MMMLSLELVT